jgi:hypothetical protein
MFSQQGNPKDPRMIKTRRLAVKQVTPMKILHKYKHVTNVSTTKIVSYYLNSGSFGGACLYSLT